LLKEINVAEWNYLIRFSYLHDFGRKNSNSFYFDANPNYIVAVDRDKCVAKFKIKPQAEFNSYLNKVKLLWHVPEVMDRKYVDGGIVWTARQTLNWIDEMLDDMKKIDKQEEAIRITLDTKSGKAGNKTRTFLKFFKK